MRSKKKIDRPPGPRIISGGSPLLTSPEKISKIPLKLRIAAVASAVGF